MKTLEQDVQFFYDNAGFSYDPKTETEEEGKKKCAIALAEAETSARNNGIFFHWEVDTEIDSREFNKQRPYYELWICTCRHPETGVILACLCGIDFGRNKGPFGQPYKRVIEAELAQEALKGFEK